MVQSTIFKNILAFPSLFRLNACTLIKACSWPFMKRRLFTNPLRLFLHAQSLVNVVTPQSSIVELLLRISSLALVVGLIVNVIVLFILVPKLERSGAAVAMVAGWLASSLVFTLAFKKYSGIKLLDIWRFRKTDFPDLSALRRRFIK